MSWRGPLYHLLKPRIERAIIRRHKRRRYLFLSDTTLRDGEQMPGVRLNADEKLQIAAALARAGIHSIDAGFPAASQEEVDSIRRIAKEVRGPVINGHCRTLKSDIDAAVDALGGLSVFKRAITLFIGISPIHREQKHHKTKAEIVKITIEAIQYAKQHFEIVTFGPEDASRTEPEFLHEIYNEAIMAGATTCGFADTVGYLTPGKAADCIKGIQDNVASIDRALLAVHFHNDLGMATANAMACIAEGVNIVQGTINGLGERAGNTPLEEVIMTLAVHPDEYPVKCRAKPSEIYELSQLVTRLTGVQPAVNKAVTGQNIFRTEAGVHQDGLLKDAHVYLPFLPEQMGAPGFHLVLGKHSGRRAVAHCAAEAGVALTEQQTNRVLEHLKGSPQRRSYESKDEVLGLLDEVFPEGSIGLAELEDTSVPSTHSEDWATRSPDGPKPR